MDKKKINRSALRWLIQITAYQSSCIIILVLVNGVLGVCSIGYAMFLRGIIDSAAAQSPQGFLKYALYLVGIMVFQIALRAVKRYLNELGRSTVENRLKSRLFQTLMEKSYSQVTGIHSGEWMNRLTSDTVVVAEGVVEILPELTGMMMQIISAIAMLMMLEPGFVIVLIPGGLLLFVLTYALRKLLKKLHRETQEADGRLRIFLQEHLGSLMIVKAFAREKSVIREADDRMGEHQKARMRKNRFSNICNVGFGTVMHGTYVFAALYCGYEILIQKISYGTFVAVLQLIGQIQNPFSDLSGILPRVYSVLASAERLMEAEQYQADGIVQTKEHAEVCQFYDRQFSRIELKDAVFSYKRENDDIEMPNVLCHMDLTISKGQYVAFTGPSGCGKSTVLKLLMSLYPLESGTCMQICKDGTAIPLTAQWRGMFAYVPQGNQLMSGTIRQVISFGDGTPDEGRISRSLKLACADFVAELPQGLNTVLGESGSGLSEGQMQRIAIARALYIDRPVLLLDEATSSLDEKTEQQLLHNIRSMTDKTVVIVTHRPAALGICDQQIRFG